MLANQVYTTEQSIAPTSAGPHAGDGKSTSLSSLDISPQRKQPGNPPRLEAGAGDWFGVLEVAEHGRFARFKRDALWVDADGNVWERDQVGIDAEQWSDYQQRVGNVAAAGTDANWEFSITLDADGNVTEAAAERVAKRGKCGGNRRGTAKRKSSFSPASRKRLLDAFNQIDTRHDMLFCTLTMPDELPAGPYTQWKQWADAMPADDWAQWLEAVPVLYPVGKRKEWKQWLGAMPEGLPADDLEQWLQWLDAMPAIVPTDDWKHYKRLLDNWLKRLKSKYPVVSGAWRMEMKRRLSGSMMGQLAPHFHLILFDVWGSNAERGVGKYMILTEFRTWASKSWAEVLGVDAARVNSDWVAGKKATGYVSRYVGKVPVEDDGQLPDAGRHWGWFNRESLPFSGVVRFVIDTFSQGRLLGLMRAIAGIPVDKRWKLPSIRVYKPLYELLQLLFERKVGIVSGNVNAIGEYAPAG
jgi:hypothetical protein